MIPIELRRNTFAKLPAGTKLTITSPGPDGREYEITLRRSRDILLASSEDVLITEDTKAAWDAVPKPEKAVVMVEDMVKEKAEVPGKRTVAYFSKKANTTSFEHYKDVMSDDAAQLAAKIAVGGEPVQVVNVFEPMAVK